MLTAEYDNKVLFERMLFDEFGREILPHFDRPENARKALLLALAIVRHINGASGFTHIGLATVAQDLGYTGNDHKFRASLNILLALGFFTQDGNVKRAPKIRMSLPEHLREKYQEDFQDSIGAELITATDKAAERNGKVSPPANYYNGDPFNHPTEEPV
ncbi:hypothetical protein ACQPYK_17125 [Streptosporangium sp. CA-135522]|uniref:hypothetical protein n=1 Tax=Streptosporangium sp. CA-135522 TaxID=3240072 RepID=UPI003D94E980